MLSKGSMLLVGNRISLAVFNWPVGYPIHISRVTSHRRSFERSGSSSFSLLLLGWVAEDQLCDDEQLLVYHLLYTFV